MKKNILKIDGLFLAIMGSLAGITDLVSYFTGKGPFGPVYFQNSIAIGGFEAHCLAIIAGFTLVAKSKSPKAKAGLSPPKTLSTSCLSVKLFPVL